MSTCEVNKIIIEFFFSFYSFFTEFWCFFRLLFLQYVFTIINSNTKA